MGFPLQKTPERIKVRLKERNGKFYVLRRKGKGWVTIAGPFEDRNEPCNFLLPDYEEMLAAWSIQVKMRCGNACKCGQIQLALLDSHHIKPKALFPQYMFVLENGEIKCLWGHAAVHQNNPAVRNMILARLAVAVFPHLDPNAVKVHGMIEL